jgi:hypothetical protein
MSERSTTPHVEPVLLTTTQLSMRIGVDVHTLRKWRRMMHGPMFVKLDNRPKSRVRYPIGDVIAWELSLPRQDRSTLDQVETAEVAHAAH